MLSIQVEPNNLLPKALNIWVFVWFSSKIIALEPWEISVFLSLIYFELDLVVVKDSLLHISLMDTFRQLFRIWYSWLEISQERNPVWMAIEETCTETMKSLCFSHEVWNWFLLSNFLKFLHRTNKQKLWESVVERLMKLHKLNKIKFPTTKFCFTLTLNCDDWLGMCWLHVRTCTHTTTSTHSRTRTHKHTHTRRKCFLTSFMTRKLQMNWQLTHLGNQRVIKSFSLSLSVTYTHTHTHSLYVLINWKQIISLVLN